MKASVRVKKDLSFEIKLAKSIVKIKHLSHLQNSGTNRISAVTQLSNVLATVKSWVFGATLNDNHEQLVQIATNVLENV